MNEDLVERVLLLCGHRDLTGRRLRQAEAVSRIKAWMERKRKEAAVIASLAQQTSDQLRIQVFYSFRSCAILRDIFPDEPSFSWFAIFLQEQRPEIALDPAYLSEQASQASKIAGLVAHGMNQQRRLR